MSVVFKDGPIEGVIIESVKRYTDARGWLTEAFRIDEVSSEYLPTMGYISETLPGVSRGPHEHVDQADMFLFIGPGEFRIQLWDNRPTSPHYRNTMTILAGASAPTRLIVPPGVVHGYRVVSDVAAMSYNFPNRLYKGVGRKEPVDEIRHEADPKSPYHMD